MYPDEYDINIPALEFAEVWKGRSKLVKHVETAAVGEDSHSGGKPRHSHTQGSLKNKTNRVIIQITAAKKYSRCSIKYDY